MTTIVGKKVGPIGYGLMGLTINEDLSDEVCFAAIKAALDAGCNYLNGGEFYGTPERNSLTLLRSYFEKYPEDADRAVVNIKGALGPGRRPAGTRESVTASIENVMGTLGPVKRIDQFEVARKDAKCDYEKETLATVDGYVASGKIGGLACSEIDAYTIRSVAKSFKLTAVELELSLFTTEPLTNGILEACGELDIPVLAYSPLGKGLLSGQLKSMDDIPEGDYKRMMPRFQGENFAKNLELVAHVEALAKSKGCTPGQVAINWLLSLSKRPGMPVIIPIPGSTKPERIRENATVVDLTAQDLAEIDKILASFVTAGQRYPAALMGDVVS
ncbi:aldo/keto reductase family protein [Hirsutella rhossiliensis]|uniref:Aldo/keto reductase family domain-containing protein n=1 Tax=Hirsutella rhossiliensis TaxID=111463 RepID=A0A9P8N352_9HYPO|nr:aldo/keto reductase family domain-containing protein [Hirsutella rhossiliensis]KAH0967448.1 aldo/keto reductase family domain-containing protein [Hirsutella rhossiliensis]